MSARPKLTIAQVAAALGVSRPTAARHVRRGAIPGGVMLYRTEGGRERWVVERSPFEEYLSNLSKLSKVAGSAGKS